MLSDHQRIKWRRNIAENFNQLSRVHERYRQTTDDRRQTDNRRQTDRRQTDGRRHIANMNMSSRSLKSKSTLPCSGSARSLCAAVTIYVTLVNRNKKLRYRKKTARPLCLVDVLYDFLYFS